jgi:transcriptional regulator with GAF, ATPase, and Fis domain
LIESELFGHERGAFTEAAARRIGWFELADRATILLDEIGELPLELQVKLLRVLQEGEFERLGSSKTMKVDVRVIAATNRNLHRAMQEGRFREDLYYRLAVYPIHLPPLRERREDIEPLALDFLRDSSRRLGKPFSGIPQRVLEALMHYDWPGNVRELQNVIERAALISTSRLLRLPAEWETEFHGELTHNGSDCLENGHKARGLTLKERERDYMQTVLRQTRWRIEGVAGAATVLGMNPSTLRSRMKKLGIQRS